MKRINYSNMSSGVIVSLSRLFITSLFILILGCFTNVKAQTVPIPDPNFRQFLVEAFPQVMDANQQLILAEAAKETGTFVCEHKKVKSLEGIQYFTSIHRLYVEYNELTSLPNLSALTNLIDLRLYSNQFSVFPDMATINPKLQMLSCGKNKLASIPDLSGHKELVSVEVSENLLTSLPNLSSLTNLYSFNCNYNQLTQLPDLSKNTGLVGLSFAFNKFTTFPDISANTRLRYINCGNNQLTSLPDFSKQPELIDLMCNDNLLTSLPNFSKNPMLEMVECRTNKLTALPDFSANTRMHTLLCDKNQLTVLPAMPANVLRTLAVGHNQLTALPDFLNNMNLVSLTCENNQLTALPDLSNHIKLRSLVCSNNPITSLPDLSKTQLYWLRAQNNLLTSLPKLPEGAAYDVFFIDGNQLTFEDILPILPIKTSTYGTYTLFPQAKLGTEETVTLKPGESHTVRLNSDPTITNNVYQWYRVYDYTKELIATTSSNTFTFSNVKSSDAGVYKCVVTNPDVAADIFTLESHLVTIQIDEPWLPVISGGDNHLIVIPNNLSTSINGTPIEIGDYIGVFFDGSNGSLVNSGMVKWTGDHLTLNAWGSTSTPKNGFLANETFKLKVWRASERTEYTVTATYHTNAPYTHGNAYAADGFSSIKALTTAPVCVKQQIALHAGWNLISINVQPDNLAMSAIFAGIQDVLVKDAAGRIKYAPQNGITNGVWNILEGYKVLVATSQTLTLCGKRIDPLTTIAIPANAYPYFLPYFNSVSMPVTSAMNSMGTNYSFVQSNEYRNGSDVLNAYNYLPAHIIDPAINQIGMMKPGLAYKVSMTTAVPAFRYPAITTTNLRTGAENGIADISLSHYSLLGSTTGNNALLIIPKDAFGQEVVEGDEIAIFTANGTLAGAGRYTNENIVITIWESEQMKAGEKYNLKVWKQDSQQELAAEVTYQRGNGAYSSNTVQMVQKARLISNEQNLTAQQIVVYPNPATLYINIKLASFEEGAVSVSLYNLMGVKVLSASKAGVEELNLEVNHLPSGQYICVVEKNGHEFRSKIAVVK